MDSKPLEQDIAELQEVDAAEAPDLADEIAARLAADLEAPLDPPGSGAADPDVPGSVPAGEPPIHSET